MVTVRVRARVRVRVRVRIKGAASRHEALRASLPDADFQDAIGAATSYNI